MRRSLTVGAVAAVLVGMGSGPALADPGGNGGGGFVPVETLIPNYYDGFEIEACGTTVLVEPGDVREVEVRQTTRGDGAIVTRFRGDLTLDLERADGATIDELDVSGPAREVVSGDGTQVTLATFGASFVAPNPDPVDLAAFAEAGLPHLAYFEHGSVTFHVTLDPETGEVLAEEIDVRAHVVDLCTWLDGGGDGHGQGHGDRGHRK
ncbi:hypothetical protein ACI797_12910 [Geodermatophilus sp. SYSU D00691]